MRSKSVSAALITAVLLAGCSSEASDQTQLRNQAIYRASADACDGYGNLFLETKRLAKLKQFNKLARIDEKYTDLAVSAYEVYLIFAQLSAGIEAGSAGERAPLSVEMWKSYALVSQFCESLAGD